MWSSFGSFDFPQISSKASVCLVFPEMYYLKSVDSISQFCGEGPRFAVVEEYTFNICIDNSDFNCVADCSTIKKNVSVLKASIAKSGNLFRAGAR